MQIAVIRNIILNSICLAKNMYSCTMYYGFFCFSVGFQEFWHRWWWPHFQGWIWSHQEQLPLPQQVWRTGQEPVSIYRFIYAVYLTSFLLVCKPAYSLLCRRHSPPTASFHRDGKISREEMVDYFMKASSLLNCKMGFIHTFTETTYFKPTFCDHCTGLVRKTLFYNKLDRDSILM